MVRGSHGRLTDRFEDGPVLLTNRPDLLPAEGAVPATAVKEVVMEHLFGE
jgi:hypothetical protein